MSRPTRAEQVDTVRRKLLKSSMVAGGLLAAGHLPYVKPAVKSFFGVRTAWAQASGNFTAQFIGTLVDLGGLEGTGQDAWLFDTTQPNTSVTINVMITSGAATPEIGLFTGLTVLGTNLITGMGGGTLGPFPVMAVLAAVGTYTLAIEDSLINALQVPFSYQIDVTASLPIVPGGAFVTDGPETLLRAGGNSS